MKPKKTTDERLAALQALLAEVNAATGQKWKIINGQPRVSCQYLLMDEGGKALCQSNMQGYIGEFLNGVMVGIEIAKGEQ